MAEANLELRPSCSRYWPWFPSCATVFAGRSPSQSHKARFAVPTDPRGLSSLGARTDPTTKTQTFGVSGWDAIMGTIQDSYPYFDRKRTALCMTTADWSFNQDANPNPMIYVTVGY